MKRSLSRCLSGWMLPVAIGLAGCANTGIQTPSGKPVTDIMADFHRGDIRLVCELSCSFAWGAASRHARMLYDQGLWVDLINEVARIGYNTDQTYFYLGRAAEELGNFTAANTYYRLSASSVMKCDGVFNVCDGFDVQGYIKAYLQKPAKENSFVAQGAQPDNPMTDGSSAPEAISPNQEAASAVQPVAIDVFMWKSLIPKDAYGLTSEWLTKKSSKLLDESASLRADGKTNDSLIKSVQSSVLLEYYIEIENFHDAKELKEKLDKGRTPLASLGFNKQLYDESLKNLRIALPEGAIKSSKHTNETVFGYKLGQKFTLPECQRSEYVIADYFYELNTNKTCIQYFPTDGKIIPYDVGHIKVSFPMSEAPEGVWGIDYSAFIINGKLEGVFFDTGGLKNMDAMFALLKRKYGEPSKVKFRNVSNLYGATFEVVDAHWTKDNTEVEFTGVGGTLDKGFVSISTKNFLAYKRATNDTAAKPISL